MLINTTLFNLPLLNFGIDSRYGVTEALRPALDTHPRNILTSHLFTRCYPFPFLGFHNRLENMRISYKTPVFAKGKAMSDIPEASRRS